MLLTFSTSILGNNIGNPLTHLMPERTGPAKLYLLLLCCLFPLYNIQASDTVQICKLTSCVPRPKGVSTHSNKDDFLP